MNLPTQQEQAAFEKTDPGTSAFFREFDKNNNQQWTKMEWNEAMTEAVQRRFLPPNFNAVSSWAVLPKTANDTITVREFIAFAANTKAKQTSAIKIGAFVNPKSKQCSDLFSRYDADRSGGLSMSEFKQSSDEIKITSDALAGTWLSLPRDLTSGEIKVDAFVRFCSSVIGLPMDEASADLKNAGIIFL